MSLGDETFLSHKLWHFLKSIRPWVANEWCCLRTFDTPNVNLLILQAKLAMKPELILYIANVKYQSSRYRPFVMGFHGMTYFIMTLQWISSWCRVIRPLLILGHFAVNCDWMPHAHSPVPHKYDFTKGRCPKQFNIMLHSAAIYRESRYMQVRIIN